jgi:hypothetical protein
VTIQRQGKGKERSESSVEKSDGVSPQQEPRVDSPDEVALSEHNLESPKLPEVESGIQTRRGEYFEQSSD